MGMWLMRTASPRKQRQWFVSVRSNQLEGLRSTIFHLFQPVETMLGTTGTDISETWTSNELEDACKGPNSPFLHRCFLKVERKISTDAVVRAIDKGGECHKTFSQNQNKHANHREEFTLLGVSRCLCIH